VLILERRFENGTLIGKIDKKNKVIEINNSVIEIFSK